MEAHAKQSKTAEAVQLYFKEGLVEPEMERAAEQLLAEAIPIPVISNQEITGDQKVLKIIVNGTQKNHFDGKSYGRILASLEAWVQELARDLNEYKIGSKAKPGN